MLGVYIAALVFGGGMVLLSALSGHGHDAAHGGHGLHHDAAHHGGTGHHGSLSGAVALLLSLRFWSFLLAFGGLAGVVLTMLGLPEAAVVPAAAATGLIAGGGAAWIFRRLGDRQTSSQMRTQDWIGRSARVTLPVSASQRGKVRIEADGALFDFVADAPPVEGAFAIGDEVIVVAMSDDGVASVARSTPTAALPRATARQGESG